MFASTNSLKKNSLTLFGHRTPVGQQVHQHHHILFLELNAPEVGRDNFQVGWNTLPKSWASKESNLACGIGRCRTKNEPNIGHRTGLNKKEIRYDSAGLVAVQSFEQAPDGIHCQSQASPLHE